MPDTIKIGQREIGPGRPVYVIAEMSANHHQDFDQAVKIIAAAKESGADAVKLQTYTPDTITIRCDRPEFRVEGTIWSGRNLYELYGEAYTPWEWQPRLKQVANDLGLDLFSSPFDATAVDFLERMNVPAHKLASFELVDIPLIQKMARTGKPLIMSTGMATLEEIQEAVQAARNAGAEQIALLKCTSAYPAAPEDMNLRTIPELSRRFGVPVGLSDHTMGIEAPVTAVALGACIIEKHLTAYSLGTGTGQRVFSGTAGIRSDGKGSAHRGTGFGRSAFRIQRQRGQQQDFSEVAVRRAGREMRGTSDRRKCASDPPGAWTAYAASAGGSGTARCVRHRARNSAAVGTGQPAMRIVSPFLKRVVYPSLSATGVLHRTAPPGLAVVTYHGVLPEEYEPVDPAFDGNLIRPEVLRQQLRLLKSHYNVISPEDALAWLQGNELPPRAVLLTCDDGLLNHLTDMLPVLQQEGVKCLFFVTAASAGEERKTLWYEDLFLLLISMPEGVFEFSRGAIEIRW